MNDWEVVEDRPSLRIARRDGAVCLTLRRPEALNAFDEELARDFLDAVRRFGADDAVRCVLVTGDGRAFSTGADIKTEFGAGEDHDLGALLRATTNPTILALRQMPKPVVAAVNGPAAGIGCSIALACDLVLAASSAYFLLPFVKLGIAPDGGATLTVPARVGLGRAAALALLAERLPAPEALSWGLVDRVLPDGELAEAAGALGLRLAAGPTRAYAAVKQELNASMLSGLEAQLELEATLQSELGTSDDFTEGVAAFNEKRPPSFTGFGGVRARA